MNKVEQATELMKTYNEISVQYEEICKKMGEEERRITPNLRNIVQQMNKSELLEFYSGINIATALKFELFKYMRELNLL
jgi:hypothetical protein